jgi:hypothetical protein
MLSPRLLGTSRSRGSKRFLRKWTTRRGCVALGFSNKDQTCIAVLGPRGKPIDGTTPILYTSNIRMAREVLGFRGVNGGEIQEDRQGTHYFEMRALKGNAIEVSEEL